MGRVQVVDQVLGQVGDVHEVVSEGEEQTLETFAHFHQLLLRFTYHQVLHYQLLIVNVHSDREALS